MREYDDFPSDDYSDSERMRARRRPGGRLTEREKVRQADLREESASHSGRPRVGDRWSTWDRAEHGPSPFPDWVITDLAAEDTELGVLKSGKEADVHLLRREVVGGPSCVVAAKRYRAADHRLFHRDSQYLEGRRMRRSRENRAMAGRTSFGRNLIAEQWAVAEFAALCQLWSAGVSVPYPVQREGTELLMEFVGAPTARRHRGWRSSARNPTNCATCGTSYWSCWSHWPARASPTATCPRTTCWYGTRRRC